MRAYVTLIALLGLVACTTTAPVTVSPSASSPPVLTDRVGNVLPPEAPEAIWTELRAQPVNLPRVPAGSDCPLTPTTQLPSATGAVAGSGPVYSVGNVISYGSPTSDGLLPAKILWVAAPAYSGPALIRGSAIDRGTPIYFSNSRRVTELRFELDTRVRAGASDQGWRYMPSTVNVDGPGCYGFQLDGPGWTTTIVMRAMA
jgi:hypothetical protein